jgi:hypothetical protein
MGCLVRLLLGSSWVRQEREPASRSRRTSHTLDCPPDCTCWQELAASDAGLRRAVDDFRFAVRFSEQLERTSKEIATAQERPRIGLFKVYVGPALFDSDLPPAIIRLDAEATEDIHTGNEYAWCALLQICATHTLALKNQIAGE